MHVRQLLSTLQSILRIHWMCGGLLRGTAAPLCSCGLQPACPLCLPSAIITSKLALL